jgi:hypothetical protein
MASYQISRAVRALGRKGSAIESYRSSGRRRFATTAAVDNDRLPLSGIRVLDMTRVLAGVCISTQ